MSEQWKVLFASVKYIEDPNKKFTAVKLPVIYIWDNLMNFVRALVLLFSAQSHNPLYIQQMIYPYHAS